MVTNPTQRRLTAILALDVAGYSRLMGLDEEGTLRTLTAYRDQLVDPSVIANRGRIVKTTGDGALIEFSSAVDALRCAVEIQGGMAERNKAVASETQVSFRMGINVGDVIIQGDDIFGDGVNVAARLEGIAQPGGICVSRSVFEQIGNRLDIGFIDLGEQKLKNIAQSVQAYAVRSPNMPHSAKQVIGQKLRRGVRKNPSLVAFAGVVLVTLLIGTSWLWRGGQLAELGGPTKAQAGADYAALSIVVLPFVNATGDQQQEYVADGITSAITSDLSRVRDAFVVSGVTAYGYKNKPVDLGALATELGVRFVLRGSVQRNGTAIRIDAQLSDTQSKAQLWSERFDGDQSNLFELQDLVTARLGNSVGREMVVVAARASEKERTSLKAGDILLQARAAELKPQSVENLEVLENLFRQALTAEPSSVTAMNGLARALTVKAFNFGHTMNPEMREAKFEEGHQLALKVKELDPGHSRIYGALALYYASHDDFPAFKRASETWLSLDFKEPLAYNFVANARIMELQPEEAISLLVRGAALDPKRPSVHLAISRSRANFMMGNASESLDWAQRVVELNPRFPEGYLFTALAQDKLGNQPAVAQAVSTLARVAPNFKASSWRKPTSSHPEKYKQWYESQYLTSARKAGLPT